ncbi:MAG: helix-turn-helix transcriptional regulator [Ruminococcus sp.]|nr:helix-turn-helix transcriptional regulator [Ruminococcus sp.]
MATFEADKNKQIFAENLRYYLAREGKTQNSLVRDLGLTASTVSDWVNGKKYPRVDKMQRIADYFGVSKADLTEKHVVQNFTEEADLQEYLEELKNRKEMRMLFSLAKGASKDDVMQAVKIIEALKKDY